MGGDGKLHRLGVGGKVLWWFVDDDDFVVVAIVLFNDVDFTVVVLADCGAAEMSAVD